MVRLDGTEQANAICSVAQATPVLPTGSHVSDSNGVETAIYPTVFTIFSVMLISAVSVVTVSSTLMGTTLNSTIMVFTGGVSILSTVSGGLPPIRDLTTIRGTPLPAKTENF